jgi:hypothetical protein
MYSNVKKPLPTFALSIAGLCRVVSSRVAKRKQMRNAWMSRAGSNEYLDYVIAFARYCVLAPFSKLFLTV